MIIVSRVLTAFSRAQWLSQLTRLQVQRNRAKTPKERAAFDEAIEKAQVRLAQLPADAPRTELLRGKFSEEDLAHAAATVTKDGYQDNPLGKEYGVPELDADPWHRGSSTYIN